MVYLAEGCLDEYSLLCFDKGSSDFGLRYIPLYFQGFCNDVIGSIMFEVLRIEYFYDRKKFPPMQMCDLGKDKYEPYMWMWIIIPPQM